MSFEAIIARHERIAFQLSGGKDSVAALLLMRPHWDKMTVYHCNPGDSMPETAEMVRRMSELVPVTVVHGRVLKTRAQYGLPTDVLPWTSSQSAHTLNAGSTPLLQDWVSCCFRSIMLPMYERMIEDKITLIVRGQKTKDAIKGALVSGSVEMGVEYLYPVEGWTDDECFAFMREHGIAPQRFYFEGAAHSGDCLHCTAWLVDDKAAYMLKHYPAEYPKYRDNVMIIADAAASHLSNLMKEASHCEAHHG